MFLGGAFGFMFAIEKTKNSAAGVAVLLGFTFFMGLMLSRLLAAVLGFSNGAVADHDGLRRHGGVFFAMATLATVIKRDLSDMGKFLFVGAVMLLVAGIINVFVQSSALMLTLSVIAIGLFSAFMLYDIKRVIDGGETNYITATLAIYLDIYNVFQSLLALLGIFGGDATERRSRRHEQGPCRGPFFHARARTPRCSPRAPCAGTCSPRPPPLQR